MTVFGKRSKWVIFLESVDDDFLNVVVSELIVEWSLKLDRMEENKKVLIKNLILNYKRKELDHMKL